MQSKKPKQITLKQTNKQSKTKKKERTEDTRKNIALVVVK